VASTLSNALPPKLLNQFQTCYALQSRSAKRFAYLSRQAYAYDANGNLTSDGTSTYTYDAANRLTSVTGNGHTSTYAYNGLGDRLSQTVDSATTNYTVDLDAGLTQVLADGTNTYLYGNGRIGELQPGGFDYLCWLPLSSGPF
jgi:YD repeat-containing protein